MDQRAMKIIVDENIPGIDEFLAGLGAVHCLPGRTITRKDVYDADVLLVRSVTQVNEALLKGSSVRFVASATAGVDHVDQDYLKKSGIRFAWAPGCNAVAVVEYVLAAITQVYAVHSGNWLGKTVGIVGCGQVGGRLHERLLAMGVNCLIYDPLVSAGDGSDVRLDTLLKAADIVTLHTPLTRSGDFPTWHMIDVEELAMMKPNALLVNAARGGVVNNAALSNHLIKNEAFTGVLDVWEDEPELDKQLLRQVFVGTGHIAGYSLEGKLRGTQMIYEALCQFLGNPVTKSMKALLPEHALSTVYSDLEDLTLSHFIEQVYNIQADSERFKALISSTYDIRSAFDQYRKTYPVRREFSNIVIRDEALKSLHQNPELNALLNSVGL